MALAVAAGTLLVFWPVLGNGFIHYDDQDYVTTNAHVQEGLTWQTAAWAFRTSSSANWHPLTWLSHSLDCQWFGLNPAGHHLTSLLFHAANASLLFVLLFYSTGAPGRSAFVAGLFALHPFHVESVAWVAERKDVLSSFFGLLCLVQYSRYAVWRKLKDGAPAPDSVPHAIRLSVKPALCYMLALLFLGLGLMCKPMLITIPLLMLFLDYWPLERLHYGLSGFRRLLIEKLPFLILSLISGLVTLQVQRVATTYYKHLTLVQRVANALVAYARYLGKTFWPRDLAVLYPHPGHWPLLYVSGAALLLALLTIAVWLNRRRRPYLFVGWLWFVVSLIPVLGLIQVGVQSMADRYTYLPLIGVFVMLVWGGAEALQALPNGSAGLFKPAALSLALGGGVSLMVLLCCAFLTRAQLLFWRNTETIFTHAIAATENNWVAHYNLALVFLGRYEQSQHNNVEPQLAQSPIPLAEHANNQQNLTRVILHCQAAIAANPTFADAYVTLAKALTERGDFAAARSVLDQGLQLDARNADAHANLAEVFLRQGEPGKAVLEYRQAVQLRPDWHSVLNNLGWLLATQKDSSIRNGREAVRLAEHACTLTGRTNLSYLHTLAAAYAQAGDFTNAVATAALACQFAQASGRPNLEQTATARLELYKAGQVLRE